MILPLFVGRASSIQAVEEALARTDRLIFLSTQKDVTTEVPKSDDIYETGTIAMIMRMRKLPDGRIKILIQGLSKGSIKEYTQSEPSFMVKIDKIQEPAITEISLETEALIRNVKDNLEKTISMGKMLSPDLLMVVEEISEPSRLSDLIASQLGIKISESQDLLETHDPIQRLAKVNETLVKEIELLGMQEKIKTQARDEMARSQREYFLREQMKAIKTELGDNDNKADEINEVRERIETLALPEEIYEEAQKQIGRLERMHPDASEASILRTYLDWIVDTPWSIKTEDNLDIKRAKRILDEDHYGLNKIKERIVEFLAVRKLKPKMKGPILCFSGPPGVGKTSLGKSIARALDRKFIRMSLGGIKDEAEMRGHRRTYVGAMPGRIIQGLKLAGSNNPVFMLDEIDKLGSDFKGDPSSALLEILDPEQNFSFRDHYLNLPFDLSNVMFIATANVLDNIPSALKDRMEVISISGYTEQEKLEIAKKYLISKQKEANGLEDKKLEVVDESIKTMINEYTREAGLRNLERVIANIFRKVARTVAEEEKAPNKITTQLIHKYLGVPKFTPDERLKKSEIGISTGLAWTQFGGEMLFIETTKMKGKGGGLTLTGTLGDVMKESAVAALTYIRANAEELGVDDSIFNDYDVHLHVPAGAIPKDGPSAGITIATALVSLFTNQPVRHDVAMTGEITITGKVLPIGGLKEKMLAALRYKITNLIVPAQNEKDLEEIPAEIKQQVKIYFAKHINEVLGVALDSKKKQKQATKSSTSGGSVTKMPKKRKKSARSAA
jgi:ATP-dependent Lon protease